MARNSKKNTALVANMTAAVEVNVPASMSDAELAAVMAMDDEDLHNAMIGEEIAEILAGEAIEHPVVDAATAMAQAHGANEALAQAANEAVDEAPAVVVTDERTYADLVASVTVDQIAEMQKELVAAFAERATYERAANPNNDNIQKTLTKVQKGHLAHGISQALRAIGIAASYLNKSEVTGKRRNVYALEKLQDLIYGANTGKVKNAINAAVLVSMVKLEKAEVAFTGAVAKACASDKIAVDAQLKGLLRRHTVAESTASTQSSSTMTALEDLGAVTNLGTQKHPVWIFSKTAIGARLREIGIAMMGGAATA